MFSRLPGKIKNGDIPDVCCDFYYNIDRDVAMRKELGVTACLWSLMDNFEWSAGFAAWYGTYYTDYKTLKCAP